MKKFYLLVLSSYLLLSTASLRAQGIVINEMMQSNVDFLMVDHDFPDSWVELYNGSSQNVNVMKYRIGPTPVFTEAYRLSVDTLRMAPGSHLVLYCDKTTGTPLHYNFNLESGKGKLYLFNNNGIIIDSLSYKKMPAPNIAYGRTADGGSSWQYELTPTPGAANSGGGNNNTLPEPLFSVEGHVMTSGPETVTVSMPGDVPADTRIYLTLDGSEPTWQSPSDTAFTLSITQSTVVRAKLLSASRLPIRSTTHSYIFHPRQTTIPIVSIATDSAFLYSSAEGILSTSITDGKPNYKYDWRRPANFEYFSTAGDSTVFNQCGEMAVGGGKSRDRAQKSIKCYAKSRFGKKNFKGDFWRDKPEVTKVKSFMLRNGGNDCTTARISDASIQRFFGTHLDNIDWQAYDPVIVYINGVYKGVFGFRERSNEDYVTSNYDVDEDDLEVATETNYTKPNVLGTPKFNAFYALYHTPDVSYEELSEEIDIDNFINVFISECYASNDDYPSNNISVWKDTANHSKWRWILKDLDAVRVHTASWNMFKYMLGTTDSLSSEFESSQRAAVVRARSLYERMMSFPEFRERFIAAYATYLGDFLRPDVCLPIVSAMDNEIYSEIAPTFAVYNMSSLAVHNSAIQRLRTYISQRPDSVYWQMADYFQLGYTIPMIVTGSTEIEISINGIPLRTGTFNGKWFTQFPLTIEAVDAPAATWTMVVTHSDHSETTNNFDTATIHPNLKLISPGDSISFSLTATP